MFNLWLLSYTCDTTYIYYYLAIYQVSLGCEEAVLGEFGLNGLPCLLAKFWKGTVLTSLHVYDPVKVQVKGGVGEEWGPAEV